MQDSRGRPLLSGNPDFTTYWNVSGGLIGIVQLEDANAPYQAFTLEQDRFGELRATQIQVRVSIRIGQPSPRT